MKLGYLGPSGSYSYQAACLYAKKTDQTVEYQPLSNFSAIIDGVETGQLAMGLLPVENSTHGAVASVMDILLNLNKGTVCGEMILNIEHCLLGVASRACNLKYVYSHEQAFEQCRHYFTSRYPHIEFIACSSTSEACELAKQGGAVYGAVASKEAADVYHLSVLGENIQDNAFNQTRFLLISCKGTIPTGQDKTSIVFAFPGDYPGSLYSILKSFACHQINLTRIESRPAKHLMGKYVFYIDFLGHQHEPLGSNVLKEVKGQVEWLKILGSYPVDQG